MYYNYILIQVVHTALSQQKCEYLSIQRQLSSSNPLLSRPRPGATLPASLKGPSPFHPAADPLTQARQTQLNRTQTQNVQGPPTQTLGQAPAFGANTSAFGANTSGFGTSTFGANTSAFGASAFGTNTSGFGAASPGVISGTKRGKH